jgi:spermidine/putrescine transport system ATP-binding protein
MSDRIAVMNHGKVEQLGTPEELYERPRTRFVADFIGTTNLLTGSVEVAAGTEPAVVRLATGEHCSVAGGTLRPGDPVELSVRPESIELRSSSGPDGSPTRITATVEQVAYLGGNVQYIVRTGGGLSITALTPKTGERLPVGGTVDVSWPASEALVLAARPTDPVPQEVRA